MGTKLINFHNLPKCIQLLNALFHNFLFNVSQEFNILVYYNVIFQANIKKCHICLKISIYL